MQLVVLVAQVEGNPLKSGYFRAGYCHPSMDLVWTFLGSELVRKQICSSGTFLVRQQYIVATPFNNEMVTL